MKINIARVLPSPARPAVMEALRFLLVFALAMAAFAALGSIPAHGEDPQIASRRAAERTDFTNDEIREGFFKIAFGAELQIDKPAGRVRKFAEPVRIYVEAAGAPQRRDELARIV